MIVPLCPKQQLFVETIQSIANPIGDINQCVSYLVSDVLHH